MGFRPPSPPAGVVEADELELSEGALLPAAEEFAAGVEPDSVDALLVSAKQGGRIIDEAVKRTSIELRTVISFPLQNMLLFSAMQYIRLGSLCRAIIGSVAAETPLYV